MLLLLSRATATWRVVGSLLLACAVATAVSVVFRLAADADQPTLPESLAAISSNFGKYLIGGVGRVWAGSLLLVAGVMMWQGVDPGRPFSSGWAAVLLGLSGVVTAVSGVLAIVLAAQVGPIGLQAVAMEPGWLSTMDRWADARVITGRAGFTLAGLGLVALAGYRWRGGWLAALYAGLEAAVGISMLFIWLDADLSGAVGLLHRVSGVAFLLWLISSGLWLLLAPRSAGLGARRV